MSSHANNVLKVVDSQVSYLARRSKELDQETRITVYTFSDNVECVIYDKDVLRMPSLRGFYEPSGCTNLVGASVKALTEAREISQRYGDHSFLFYIFTDGENTRGAQSIPLLSQLIDQAPDNFTIACLVPDQTGVHEANQFGFPIENISIWNTTRRDGFEEAGKKMQDSTEVFLQARAKGLRGTKNLFSMNVQELFPSRVARACDELTPSQYQKFDLRIDSPIKEFVEAKTRRNYVKGHAYYQLTKPEDVQNYKQVCIEEKKTGKIFTGPRARNLLKLPDHQVRLAPLDHHNFNIFVQSTSLNRKLLAGTSVIVLK